jgi:hypothetical protein
MAPHKLRPYNLHIVSGQVKHSSDQNRQVIDAIKVEGVKAIIRDTQDACPAALVGNFNIKDVAQVTSCLGPGWQAYRSGSLMTPHMTPHDTTADPS